MGFAIITLTLSQGTVGNQLPATDSLPISDSKYSKKLGTINLQSLEDVRASREADTFLLVNQINHRQTFTPTPQLTKADPHYHHSGLYRSSNPAIQI